MDIAQEARAILESHGYTTVAIDLTGQSFSFEDANLFGAAFVYDGIDQLLSTWEPRQDRFLAEFAGRLRAVPDKLWSIYTIHFTGEQCDTARSTALFSIEEDFRGTRKIARGGLRTKEDVISELLSLLPIQNLIEMGSQDADELVRQRLMAIHPAFNSLFTSSPIAELAARLMERP